MSVKPLTDPIAEEAISWMVRMRSGDFSEQEQSALHSWLEASPRHEKVFQQLSNGLSPLRDSPWCSQSGEHLLRAIQKPSSRRQLLRNSLVWSGFALGAGLIVRGQNAGLSWDGDFYTGTGERRFWTLEDGSRLDLNARSSVKLLFTPEQRSLLLLQGELLVNVAADRRGPLVLDTPAGVVRVQQGKLLLREEADAIRLVTLDSSAELIPKAALGRVLMAHQSVLFNHQGVLTQNPMQTSETAWLAGSLIARNQTLSWVIDSMRPYRRGILRVESGVENLRVSGLYPLDDTEQTLTMLEHSLPIRVTRHSSYWITIRGA